MISTVFTLLLAGAMVSQVFSERPVLLAVFDGINDEFIDKMPDLQKDKTIGKLIARPRLLKSENPTKPFSLLHTLATGVLPSVHGVINNTMFDRNGNIMFNTDTQFKFNEDLKTIWAEAVQYGNQVATLRWPGADLVQSGEQLIITEKYREEVVDWNSHITKIKNWFQSEGVNFGMAYFEDTDNKVCVDTYIEKAYQTIKNLYNELSTLDVDIIIMSSHGKKEIEKEKVLRMEHYAPSDHSNRQFIVSGGVSFIRFNNIRNLEETYIYLRNIDLDGDGEPDHGTKFIVHKREESDMKEWNLENFDLLENTLFVSAINGHTFYDRTTYDSLNNVEKVRENGYLKSDEDMDAILLLIGDSFKDNVVTNDAIELKEVYQLIKKLLGLTKDASEDQPVEDLTGGMKELIEPSVLAQFDANKNK